MFDNLPLFPEAASSVAWDVDLFFFFMLAVSLFFTVLIFGLLIFFAIRYRRRSEDERPRPILANLELELIWTVIPFILVMVMFGWGAKLYFDLYTPPARAMEIYAVGLQWMWKIQHPNGQQEINELHVPVGQPVKLIMTSQDVIHSFYIPAFRVKKDVLPGRYTTMWFEATKPGEYHLFCAEYCGTEHSRMIGRVVALRPGDYERWLVGATPVQPVSMADEGERIFTQLGCRTCHTDVSGALGPSLHGVFGSTVELETGGTVVADEEYIRESILQPAAKIVSGYMPVMPSYQGQVSEEELNLLVEYVKSLAD